MATHQNRISGWFVNRFNLKRDVPKYSTHPLYGLGGLATACAVMLGITGIFLSTGYKATVEGAYQSVATITNDIPYGSVLRGIHRYAADLMILFAIFHFFRIFLTASYRKPRELTWIIGIFGGVLVILMAYTGYTLPLTEMSLAASFIGSGILMSVPFIGDGLFSLFIGSGSLQEMVSRFSTFHVSLLPGLIILALMLHFYLIREHRVSEPYSVKQDKSLVRFYPNLLLTELSAVVFLSGILVILASIMPVGVGLIFDPMKGTPPVEPEWYLLALYSIFKTGLPIFEVGILFVGTLLIALIAIPFIDVQGNKHPKDRPFYTAFAIVLALSIIIFTYWGYVTPGQTIPLIQAAVVALVIILVTFISAIALAHRKIKEKNERAIDTEISNEDGDGNTSALFPFILVLIVLLQIIFVGISVKAHLAGNWNIAGLSIGIILVCFAISMLIYRAAYLPYTSNPTVSKEQSHS